MTIVDLRHGGEIVTSKGKVFMFDSLECLLGFYRQTKSQEAKLYVLDFERPGELIAAENASFVRTNSRNGPMGSTLIALSSSGAAQRMTSEGGGQVLSWQELLQKGSE